MTHREALEVVARHRRDCVVVTTMTSVGIWPELSDTPLDFAYMPSAMGQAPGIGLGLALACPGRGVIVVNGDGCTLMNLGCLVTLAANPAAVYLLILDNALYEVTGGQPVPGTGKTDYAMIARGAGIGRVYRFANLAEWDAGAAEALSGPGPVVVWLSVEGRTGQKTPRPPRSMTGQVARLRGALATRGADGRMTDHANR
jgi:sulfopyruvate decarboxylase subunit beta